MRRPNIIVQLSSGQKVADFRAGLGDAIGIVALCPEGGESFNMAGIDAMYLSVTRAERWGAQPITEHTVAALRTNAREQEQGVPPFVLTGFLLREGDPDTPEFGIPRLVKALIDTIARVNAGSPGAIGTVGFFEYELSFRNCTLARVARLFADALSATTEPAGRQRA